MQGNVDIPRRTLLHSAAAFGAIVLAGGSLSAMGGQAQAREGASNVAQYGFMVRTSRCVNCQECVAACRAANKTPEGVEARRKVSAYTTANGQSVFASTGCMHCESPACATVCPAGAITKGEGGVVVANKDRCIGCKYCYQACPFSVPHYTSEGMDKCDCCLESGVALGDAPNCVKACNFRALSYGPLDELLAAAGGKARQVECSTGPSYVLQ